jgi:hypothetical protein
MQARMSLYCPSCVSAFNTASPGTKSPNPNKKVFVKYSSFVDENSYKVYESFRLHHGIVLYYP